MMMMPESPKVQSHKRGSGQRVSMIESEGNPMGSFTIDAVNTTKDSTIKVENISDATLISSAEFDELVEVLTKIDDNLEILVTLDLRKLPHLFSSTQLLKLLEITPSVKTRLAMISSLGPRLTDPNSKAHELQGIFRFSQDQAEVEEVLKQRQNTLQASKFMQGSALSKGPMGGRGGAGRGGRGGGMAAGRGAATGRGAVGGAVVGGGSSSGSGLGGEKSSAPSSNSLVLSESALQACCKKSLESIDETTDGEHASEHSDSSPGEQPHTSHEQHSHGDDKPVEGEKRRVSALVIRSRAVTVKTAAEITEEKLSAVAAAMHHSEAPGPAAPLTKSNSVPSAVMATPKPGLVRPSLPTTQSLGTTARPFERSEKKIVDSKSWMRNVVDTPAMPRIPVEVPSSSFRSASNGPSVVRTLFETVDSKEDGSRGLASHSSDSLDSARGTLKTDNPYTQTLSRSFSDHLTVDVSAHEGGEEGPRTCPQDGARISRRFTALPSQTPMKQQDIQTGTVTVSELTKAFTTPSVNRVSRPVFLTSQSLSFTPAALPRRRASSVELTTTSTASSSSLLYDTKTLSVMHPEGPVGESADGQPLFSYMELVRRNHLKVYGELVQTELEQYMIDGDFLERFGMSKDAFNSLPKWKRVSQKKALLLF